MPKFITTIEVEVEISYCWDAGEKGVPPSMSDPGEPSCPAFPYDIEIKYPDFVEFNEADTLGIEEECEADMEERKCDE